MADECLYHNRYNSGRFSHCDGQVYPSPSELACHCLIHPGSGPYYHRDDCVQDQIAFLRSAAENTGLGIRPEILINPYPGKPKNHVFPVNCSQEKKRPSLCDSLLRISVIDNQMMSVCSLDPVCVCAPVLRSLVGIDGSCRNINREFSLVESIPIDKSGRCRGSKCQ